MNYAFLLSNENECYRYYVYIILYLVLAGEYVRGMYPSLKVCHWISKHI